MRLWTLIGLLKGKATTQWPKKFTINDGQENVVGMPQVNQTDCPEGCNACVDVCLTDAIIKIEGEQKISLDYGKCINCQMCTDTCPTDMITPSNNWAFGVKDRSDLMLSPSPSADKQPVKSNRHQPKNFKRSLHIRHIDAGSCNGCESELEALENPFYNLDRFGIFFTPAPRHADLLLITGPVTYNMRDPILAAYEAMPEPKWVMAVGTCAVSGGSNGGGYACQNGLEDLLEVDLYLPGCPPNPSAILSGLLTFLQRLPQRVHGGQYACD